MLTLTTLGRWGLRAGEPADSVYGHSPSKSLGLVVYLACAPGATARRERLVDLLWADLEPDAADHALRQIVWLLRRRLGEECILSAAGSVVLGCPVECDRTAFLQAIESQDFEAAAQLYAGDFLPGFAAPGGAEFEKWADLERRRLQDHALLAYEVLARRWLSSGRIRDATVIARRARDANRDREPGWRLLFETLSASGDTVSAAVEAEELRRLLDEERRTPEPATILAIRRALDEPHGAAAAQPRPLVAELVGREQPFTAITAAWEAVRAGRGRHVHITGAAGLGKTRLLHDAAARLSASGAAVVALRANPGERDLPFTLAADLAAALAELPGSGAIASASADALVALNPRLSSRFPAATRAHVLGADTARLFTLAIAELLEAVADEASVAVAIDDVHWMDAESRHLLGVVLPRVAARHILFITAARPDPEGRLERDGTERIALDPLGTEHVAVLLASVGTLPDTEWAAQLPNALERSTLGSPLLILETLRLALARELLRLSDGCWTSEDPVGLYDLLAAGGALHRRITALDRDRAWLLTMLSAAGVPVDQRVLVAAVPRPEPAILEDLRELDCLALATRQGDRWCPAHDEIAERALNLATPEQRGAAHASLGRALLARPNERGALRSAAHHLAAASLDGELTTAAASWVRASRAGGDRRSATALVAELLGEDHGDPAVRRLTASLPWVLRLNRARALAAAAVVLVLLLAAGLVTIPFLTPEGEGVLVGDWRQEPAGRWRLYARELTARDMGAGHLAIPSLKRTGVVSWDRPRGNIRPGSSGSLATTRAFPDSGGEDVVLIQAGSGTPVRLTSSRGDDTHGAWSPDGRYLVIPTDRWSNASQSNLAIIDPDHPDSVLVRLTRDPTGRDAIVLWSPDGSRIAFWRAHYVGERPGAAQICLVSVDGSDERCLTGPRVPTSLIGWGDATELVAGIAGADGASHIVVLNTETGSSREIAEGEPIEVSRAPGWIHCYCRRNATEPYQTLVIPVARPDRAVRIEPGDPPPALALFAAGRPRAYLDRLRIVNADRLIPLDGSWRLELQGWTVDGEPIEPQAVRWWSGDTLVAVVDGGGEVHPRRAGRVTIHVTSGGWRQDSVTIRIGEAEAHSWLRELWLDDYASRWVTFGEPHPFIAESDRGRALAPNGDSTFVSGAFTRTVLPSAEGVGVEFDLSAPISANQWQYITVALLSADSLDWRSWDLENGHLPAPLRNWQSCAVAYPESGSGPKGDYFSVLSGISRFIRAPPGMKGGEWARIRLQYFPDKRCGLAVNGEPRAILDRRVPMGDSAIVLIQAYSHRTRILVGPLEVWLGVRRDVDWNAAGGRVSVSEAPRATTR